jgi:hypothetical protein
MKAIFLATIAMLAFLFFSGCVSPDDDSSGSDSNSVKKINASVSAMGTSGTRFVFYNDDFFDYTGVQIALQRKFICDTNSVIPARQKLDIRIDDCEFQGFSPRPGEVTYVEINTDQGNDAFVFD